MTGGIQATFFIMLLKKDNLLHVPITRYHKQCGTCRVAKQPVTYWFFFFFFFSQAVKELMANTFGVSLVSSTLFLRHPGYCGTSTPTKPQSGLALKP